MIRRLLLVVLGLLALAACTPATVTPAVVASPVTLPGGIAAELAALPIHDPAPMTGYSRAAFLPDEWANPGGCDFRDQVLRLDLHDPSPATGCVVRSGNLPDPYTGATIPFSRSRATVVQIDHIVALGDAWQTGAAAWNAEQRHAFATSVEWELIAVSGRANEQKGDRDAAQWLPVAGFRCEYVARQVEIKRQFGLWTTPAEHAAMAGVLAGCGVVDQ
jgi:hypothetical protein